MTVDRRDVLLGMTSAPGRKKAAPAFDQDGHLTRWNYLNRSPQIGSPLTSAKTKGVDRHRLTPAPWKQAYALPG